MNKYFLDGVLVVEGKEDVSYLSTFIDTLYFTTNGFDVSDEKLNFLQRVSKVNKVFVLTDNDEAGEKIRSTIKSKISDVFVIKTEEIYKNNAKKRGIAETNKEAIINSLDSYLSKGKKRTSHPDYNLNKIISLSQDPHAAKEQLVNKYRLINGNIKFLEKQLEMLKIEPQELWK